MTLLHAAVFLAGTVCVYLVVRDVFQAVVVPRWGSNAYRLSPILVIRLWPLWKRKAEKIEDQETREDFLGTFAPFVLMAMLVMWLTSLTFSYGLLDYALDGQIQPPPGDFGSALYTAGSSLLTMGVGNSEAVGTLARITALAAGATGLAVFALVISMLFTLYTAFERREIMVLSLDGRAGSPPSGLALLEIYSELDLLDNLPSLFYDWEKWSAEVLQSHIAYPLLAYFRSSHESESWIAAMGAVLDAATLLLTTVDPCDHCGKKPIGSAHLMYKLGCHTVIDLSHFFGIRMDENPNAGPGVERMEWEIARKKLAKCGFSLKPEAEAWDLFQRKRTVYAASLNELAKHFTTPPAQWVGDRSTIRLTHPANNKARRNHPETITETRAA